jgi:protein XagA
VLKRCVAFALGLACAPSIVWAGAWTLPDGTGQWLATLASSSATNYLEGSSGLMPTARYNKDELSALIEYGFTDQLTGIFNPGLQHIDIAAPTDAQRSGLGYTELGARYGFFQTPQWVASAQATLRIPGTFDTSNPAAVGYTDVEGDFRLLLGHNFYISGLSAFFDLEVAERARTAGAPSEFRVDGTLGVKIFPQWMLLAQSFNIVSEGEGAAIYGGSYDYFKLQLSAVYTIAPTWWVQGGGFTTYAGRNALQENGLLVAVGHQF